MKNDTKTWIAYADENYESARVLKESKLFNPCLHNCQQAVEKYLKAVIIERSIGLERTHNIVELKELLAKNDIHVSIEDDECDLLD